MLWAEAAGKDRVTRVRELPEPDHLPALDPRYAIDRPAIDLGPSGHPPRILLLYGSLRAVSYSRAAVKEAARLGEAVFLARCGRYLTGSVEIHHGDAEADDDVRPD
jgi:hypothetical protein